jgi:hypothetical protein
MTALNVLINAIIALIVIGVIWWAIQQLLPLVPLPEPFRRVIYVLMVVVMVLIIVYIIMALIGTGLHLPYVRLG